MSEQRVQESDEQQKDQPDVMHEHLGGNGNNEDADIEQAAELGVSPSKASYLRKLKQGIKITKSRSQLQIIQNPEHGPAASANDEIFSLEEDPIIIGDIRNKTQVFSPGQGRQSSPNKQSVLVKRVMQDGRVVSGLDNSLGLSPQKIEDEDQGTLGSQDNQTIDAIAKESNVVNYAPHDQSQSRMRSTMYISGKSQKFAMKKRDRSGQGRQTPSMGNTMIINLGERTATNFGNNKNQGQVDMIVGVTDIETGASRVQHTSPKNFNPKMKPKQTFKGRSNSSFSAHGSSLQLNHNTQGGQTETAAQVRGSEFATPTPDVQNIISQTGHHKNETHQVSKGELSPRDPMLISSLSPKKQSQTSPSAQHESKGVPDFSPGIPRPGAIQLQVSPPVVNRKYKKPEMAEISVTNVDPRSLIPSQGGRDLQHKTISPTLRTKRTSQQTQPMRSLSPQKMGKPAAKQDLKQFHQQQAQQYKDFMRMQQQKSRATGYEHHDQSQSTLMDHVVHEETDKLDASIELQPNQHNQGTQPSEIMMQSLENQLEQLKQATNDSFFVPGSSQHMQAMTAHRGDVHNNRETFKLMETIQTDGSGQNMPFTTQNQTALATHEPFKLTDRNNQINSNMLSTYRGADNMKIKMIEQSVLKTYGGSHTSSQRKTISPKRFDHAVDASSGDQIREEEDDEPVRKSIAYEHVSFELPSQQNPVRQMMPLNYFPNSFESDQLQKASPMSKIESFRALLRQESQQNDFLIANNQDNFRNLINPEVTRKEYTIMGKSPSNSDFFFANSQNQALLQPKGEMLHTFTDDFLAEKYPTTRDGPSGRGPVKVQRFQMDPNEFRMKLSKKIEELRRLEVSDSQIMREMKHSRHSRGTSQGTMPMGTVKQKTQSLIKDEEEQNTLFMTYLQHGNKYNQSSLMEFAREKTEAHQSYFSKQFTGEFDKTETDIGTLNQTGQTLPQIVTPIKQQVTRFEDGQKSIKRSGMHQATVSEKVLIQVNEQDTSSQDQKISPGTTAQAQRYLNIRQDPENLSFADKASSRKLEKSRVTLASSGSANTVKRIAKRYQREQRIVIFEDGADMTAKTPCFQIELNSLLFKYWLQQNGQSAKTTNQQDITAQVVMYQRAVTWILDQCGTRLCLKDELTPEEKVQLGTAAPKRFNTLYTVYGEIVDSLIQIDEEACILIAGDKKTFKGLKTSQLFKQEEAATTMLNRIVGQQPLGGYDTKSPDLRMINTASTRLNMSPKSKSPFKRQKTTESPGKTFMLTQGSAIGDATPTKLNLQVTSKLTPKRYVSLTSREIIKASKQELMEQLTSPKDALLKGQLNQQSGANTLRQKRLAQITMVTKGIKKGKLPPVKSPKQLDVFVFGEKGNSASLSKQMQSRTVITGATMAARKLTTMNLNAKQNSIDQYSTAEPNILVSQEQAEVLRKKRVTQFELQSGPSLLNSIKQDGSIASIEQHSSMGNIEINEIDVEQQYGSRNMDATEADVNIKLLKQLESVHSIQQIRENNEIGTRASYRTQQKKEGSTAVEKISDRNINVAKMALRERSPSYLNNKLVSSTSMQDQSQRTKVQTKLTRKEKETIKADINEHVLQNALKQREQWRLQHNLNDKQLFKLFSEFSSMMQINRMEVNQNAPGSFKERLAKATEKTVVDDAYMNKLFPIGSKVSSTKYNKMQKEDSYKNHKLKKTDLQDFRVPISICINYSEVLRPTKAQLRTYVMNALGILTSQKAAKITYDQFLQLNSFIRYNNGAEDDYFWFCVKLFDPQLTGFTKAEECERVIDLLFDNQDEQGVTTKPPPVELPTKQPNIMAVVSRSNLDSDSEAGDDGMKAGEKSVVDSEEPSDNENVLDVHISGNGEEITSAASLSKPNTGHKSMNKDKDSTKAKKKKVDDDEGKDESVASNIKKICYDKGIFKADGFLDPYKLHAAFAEGLLDVEDFKSALK